MNGEKCSCRAVEGFRGTQRLYVERCAYCLGLEKRVEELEGSLSSSRAVVDVWRSEVSRLTERIATLEVQRNGLVGALEEIARFDHAPARVKAQAALQRAKEAHE